MIHIRLALRLDLLPKTKYFDVKCPFRFVVFCLFKELTGAYSLAT